MSLAISPVQNLVQCIGHCFDRNLKAIRARQSEVPIFQLVSLPRCKEAPELIDEFCHFAIVAFDCSKAVCKLIANTVQDSEFSRRIPIRYTKRFCDLEPCRCILEEPRKQALAQLSIQPRHLADDQCLDVFLKIPQSDNRDQSDVGLRVQQLQQVLPVISKISILGHIAATMHLSGARGQGLS